VPDPFLRAAPQAENKTIKMKFSAILFFLVSVNASPFIGTSHRRLGAARRLVAEGEDFPFETDKRESSGLPFLRMGD
jgi:hypothetical protein